MLTDNTFYMKTVNIDLAIFPFSKYEKAWARVFFVFFFFFYDFSLSRFYIDILHFFLFQMEFSETAEY